MTVPYPPPNPPAGPLLDRLSAAGWYAPVDVQFARAACRLANEDDPRVLRAAAEASRAVLRGHVCADLASLVARPVLDADGEPIADAEWPPLSTWRERLARSPLVGDGHSSTPLVLEGNRLYLSRYHAHERHLAGRLCARAADERAAADPAERRAILDALFPPDDEGQSLQRLAAIVAAERGLCVVSGGPGTGKTTTVLRLLALLMTEAVGTPRFPLRIVMLAPTGKAAARLSESIRMGRDRLRGTGVSDIVLDAIPDDAATIHRALGFRPDRPTRIRRTADDPLPADVVVVDEASMIDLALMTRLVDAVPTAARLILLGDRDQLASVEAGAILGDVCHAGAPRPGFTPGFRRRLETVNGRPAPVVDGSVLAPDAPPIADCIVHLSHSWRFDARSGIGGASRAINAGRAREALTILRGDTWPDVRLVEPPDGIDPESLIGLEARDGYAGFLRATDPTAALIALDRFRVLCAHRTGPFGAVAVNWAVERALAEVGLLDPRGTVYPYRPILVTHNDYQLDLFNGDVGVVLPDDQGHLRAWFPARGGGPPRHLLPARLPPHETVFAMTVHKSQGSEFDRVALLLPRQVSRVLTRELVYTGLTRARRAVTVYGPAAVVEAAARRPIDRASGLRARLWSHPDHD